MAEPSALSSAALNQWPPSLRAPQPALAPRTAQFDLTPAKSYDTLVRYGKSSLPDQDQHGYRQEGPGPSAQRFGSFSADQERRLEDLRRACADLLTEPAPPAHAAAEERSLRTASVEGRH